MSDYTPSQAFDAANHDCQLLSAGGGRYQVQYAYRDINGPRTTTHPTNYWKARSQRVGLVIFTAMNLLGYSDETCQWTRDKYSDGSARTGFRNAMKAAGPVEMGEEK